MKMFLVMILTFFSVVTYADDKIPARNDVPVTLNSVNKITFDEKAALLDNLFQSFKDAADAFSAKAAEDQTDEEYEALQKQRESYIAAVNDFNSSLLNVEAPEMDYASMAGEKRLIEQRIEAPNKWAAAIYAFLKTEVPPLPPKKFDELQSGDVLLINAKGFSKIINKADNLLSWDSASGASHTVLYLKEVKGVKHFLENIPGEGPRIIFEDEVLKRYSSRGAEVARLAQPLNEKEAKALYGAAVEMAAKNRKSLGAGGYLGTNYGAWGKDNVVCSEADWALLNMAKADKISPSGDKIKSAIGIDYSPADFFKNGQYFFVSPVDMDK